MAFNNSENCYEVQADKVWIKGHLFKVTVGWVNFCHFSASNHRPRQVKDLGSTYINIKKVVSRCCFE